MSKAEIDAYYHHLDNLVILKDNITTARGEGKLEGLEEGMEKGMAKGMVKEKLKNARSLKENGVPVDIIAKSLGLSAEEVENL